MPGLCGRVPFGWAAGLALALVMGTGPARAVEQIRILAWPQYIAPELTEKFHKATGIAVAVEEYDADETLLTRLKTQPGKYDLATPADPTTNRLVHDGLVERIDAGTLPGFANVSLQWRSPPYDPNNLYHVPFDWGTTSFMVDTAAYAGPTESLAVLFDPPDALKGKIGMLRDTVEVVGLALRYLGLPRCTVEQAHLDRLRALLERQKPWVQAYDTERDRLTAAIAEGKTVVQMVWSGDALNTRQKLPDIRYVYPKEGILAWTTNLVVPKGSRHRQAALRFISFAMQPENSALQSNFSQYPSPIQGAEDYLPEDLQNAPETIMPVGVKADFVSCPPDVLEKHQRLWETILPKS